MKKFKKFLTVVLTLAMVVGLFGVQSAMKAKAADELTVTAAELAPTPNAHIQLTVKDGETPVESGITWKVEGKRDNSTTVADGGMLAIGSNEVAGTVLSITAEIGDEGSKKTGTLNLTVVAMAGEAYDFTVWVNGKDIKANAAKNIKAALYKTSASIEHITAYSGGKWNILVTDDSVTDKATLIKLIDKKGKADKNATAVKNGADLAKAKMKDGVITVTSNKKAGKFYVWVYETKKKGKDVEVVDRDGVAPECYTGISKMANKGLVLSDKVNAQGFTTDKSLAKLDTLPAKEITLYILNKGDAAADKDCTYSVTVPSGQTKVTAAVNNSNKTVTLTVAKDAGSEKGTAYKLTIMNDQSQQKATFTLTVKNPTIAGEKEITIPKSGSAAAEATYKVMTGKTELKDATLSMKEQAVTGVTFANNKLTVADNAQAGKVTIVLKGNGDAVITSFEVDIKAAPAATPAN